MTAIQHLDAVLLERELTGYALEQTHPLVRAWRGEHLKLDLGEVTTGLVALTTDDDAARKFAEARKVLALPAELFKVRLIEIEGYRFLESPIGDQETPCIQAACV